ncbi:MAG: YkgJ family cysteine cluster protein [Desulforhopalus sp.]
MTTRQAACRRCGNCCKQGGPALHTQDLGLITSGKIPISSLITIRKGELAYNPVAKKNQPTLNELVKIVGTGRRWDCCYHDELLGCTIYEYRPVACRTLKCWDTDEILKLVEEDTLSRFDILESIDKDDPLIQVIKEHDRICPCEELGDILDTLSRLTDKRKNELEKLVRNDLRFRTRVIADFQLKLREELFYFGRPFFQLLHPLGARISESTTGIHLNWAN